MAVQKSKKSRSRTRIRRNGKRKETISFILDNETGLLRRSHHIDSNGYYNGKLVLKVKEEKKEQEEN